MKEIKDVLTRIVPHICVCARHSFCKAHKFQQNDERSLEHIETIETFWREIRTNAQTHIIRGKSAGQVVVRQSPMTVGPICAGSRYGRGTITPMYQATFSETNLLLRLFFFVCLFFLIFYPVFCVLEFFSAKMKLDSVLLLILNIIPIFFGVETSGNSIGKINWYLKTNCHRLQAFQNLFPLYKRVKTATQFLGYLIKSSEVP